jgi:hypothetical protein
MVQSRAISSQDGQGDGFPCRVAWRPALANPGAIPGRLCLNVSREINSRSVVLSVCQRNQYCSPFRSASTETKRGAIRQSNGTLSQGVRL